MKSFPKRIYKKDKFWEFLGKTKSHPKKSTRMRRANMLWSQQSQVGQDASARLIHDDESVEGVHKQHLWKKLEYSKDTVSWRKELSRFEQNRFYGNSLPRGRPSRDRPSCEVLSNPPLSCETFDLTWFELWDLWLESLWNFVTLCQVCEIRHGCSGEEEAS